MESATREPVDSYAGIEALLRSFPPHSPAIRLDVGSLDVLRAVTLLGPDVTVDRLVVTVTEWERPLDRWVGRPGQVDGVAAYSVRYPAEEPGPARADIELSHPVALAEAVRAVYPLLGVHRGWHGYGLVEIATVDAPTGALALLPSPTAPGVPGVPSEHLEGLGLSPAEIALVGSETTLRALEETADDPVEAVARRPLLVEPSGHLALTERQELPLVDLHVHNPIGRLYTFAKPAQTFRLSSHNGLLTFTSTHVDPEPEAPTGWSRPTAVALTGSEVARLRNVESIDLGGLVPGAVDEDQHTYHRLAELAATGVVLHSLPPSLSRADDLLGPALSKQLRAPYRSSTGLVRELRSVPQRREAMRRFGGFFELARHAESTGHRLLPRVSVVLSTMRPRRVADVLHALAEQSYAHLEIVVGLHGVDGPVGAACEEALEVSGATMHRYDGGIPFGSVLADLARRTTGDLIVKIDDDDIYGPHVIEDLVLAYLYTGADVVGKTTEYLYFEDIDVTVHRRFATERYHTQVAGGAMLLSRAALVGTGGWRPTPNSTDRSVLIRIAHHGGVAYRTQSLGYIYIRHAEGHTWERNESQLLGRAPEQWPRLMREIIDA